MIENKESLFLSPDKCKEMKNLFGLLNAFKDKSEKTTI